MRETFRELDAEALTLFARKGLEAGPDAPQVGQANGVKVRRIMQITRDLAQQSFGDLRILDLGCGEGVYAIEAGLRGANVLALDARRERMDLGIACAARHGLDNVTFRQEDVRQVSRRTHGDFDVVYCLGLLYHLDEPDVFLLLERLYELCTGMLVLDTLISLAGGRDAVHRNSVYDGQRFREHGDEDADKVRRARLLRSIDNTFSFRFTRASLVRVLHDIGFTTVFECSAPPEPLKAEGRITLVALVGQPVVVSTYPWVNGMSEAEIAERLQVPAQDR